MNNKGADQPVHPRSLISIFVVHCLDSITASISQSFYIPNFKHLPSFCGCPGRFVSYLVANPKDRFSHDLAYIYLQNSFQWVHSASAYHSTFPPHTLSYVLCPLDSNSPGHTCHRRESNLWVSPGLRLQSNSIHHCKRWANRYISKVYNK